MSCAPRRAAVARATLARSLRRLYPNDWQTRAFNRLLCSKKTYNAVLAGKTVSEIQAAYREELESFRSRRKRFLLYK